jgi:hypothetical protein
MCTFCWLVLMLAAPVGAQPIPPVASKTVDRQADGFDAFVVPWQAASPKRPWLRGVRILAPPELGATVGCANGRLAVVIASSRLPPPQAG